MSEQVTAKGLALLIEAVREVNDSQRRQLLIHDSQVRAFKEIANRLESLEERFEEILCKFHSVCKICSRLNILCSPVGTKTGTTNDDGEKKDIEHELTHWN